MYLLNSCAIHVSAIRMGVNYNNLLAKSVLSFGAKSVDRKLLESESKIVTKSYF